MKKLFANAKVRLAARALLAGVAVFVSTLTASKTGFGLDVLKGAGTAAVWAALEAFTPLNQLVKVFQAKAAPAPAPPAK